MTDLKISTAKKLDLICEKLFKRIEKRVQLDSTAFYACKTVDDVLTELGSETWRDVLYEVGYSTRYCVDEVSNLSPRFCRLYDKALARFDKETEEKIMKLI